VLKQTFHDSDCWYASARLWYHAVGGARLIAAEWEG